MNPLTLRLSDDNYKPYFFNKHINRRNICLLCLYAYILGCTIFYGFFTIFNF